MVVCVEWWCVLSGHVCLGGGVCWVVVCVGWWCVLSGAVF